MKRTLLFLLSSLFLFITLFIVALYVPTSLPTNSDFSALYNTDLALVNRVPIYDLPKMEILAQQHSGIPQENFFLARFPYPPWYTLSTFHLGVMPAQAAATLWFELNLVMLFLSIWFLTDGWNGRLRLIAFPLGLFFLPVLGALAVGQYDFPVLLGISLLIYSLRKENMVLTVVGFILLTFKPHVGALILLSGLGWLIGSRNSFGRRLVRPLLYAGTSLVATGFIADPAWIISYPKMLLNYQNEGNVSACSECASLPVWLSRWFFDGSLSTATRIAIVLLVILIVLFYLVRSSFKTHEILLTAALLITLLVSPYLYNYDFLLLLIPFAVLVKPVNLYQIIIVLICYFIPTFALLLLGRAGNISLILVTIVLTALLYWQALRALQMKNFVIDDTSHAA
jgi:hypothetical protein